MDYSFFDGLIDSVFVINADRGILYCNEAAAKLCGSSVRRLAKGKPIYETIEFADANLFTMPNGKDGEESPHPYTELTFKLKSGGEGKVQIAIQPFAEPSGEKRWVVMLRDVTLEEVLHAKYHKQLEEKEVYIHQLQEAQKKLEDYSKNLEHMVEERTKEVKRAYTMLNAIMNSLGQGFLVFDSAGLCSQFYTRACEDILESKPSGQKIWDVLKVRAEELETFHMWLKAIYGEQLPFDTLRDLGPSLFAHSQDRHVKLEYFPLRNEADKIENVVVVATDQTSEFLANKALEKEKKFAKMVVKLVTSKKQFSQFLDGVPEIIFDVLQKINASSHELDHAYIFRMLHTLEGEAATYSATDIWSASRASQEIIEPLKRGESVDIQSIRQKLVGSLNHLKSEYETFLSTNSELFSLVGIGQGDKIEVTVEEINSLMMKLNQYGVSSQALKEIEDALLREPIGLAFRHYQDVVKGVAQKISKELLPIQFSGEDTRVFLDNYQALFSSFIHSFRNAVDHGIEPPEEREMMGKPRAGQIQVRFESFVSSGKCIRIVIEDDGGGIPAERIRNKLALANPDQDFSAVSDDEIIQHVFDSGVSTKDEIGEFSGRGIGLNAVKYEAENLGGRAWVETVLGKGTKLIVEVPDLPHVAQKLKAA